jgi:hypothetical protein
MKQTNTLSPKTQRATKPARQRSQTLVMCISLACSVLFPSQAHADTQGRTSSFEYYFNGQLLKEVVEPGNPQDCLQTIYVYDGYGNKNNVATSACANASGNTVASAAPRTATNGYGADGRFPLITTNALGQSESKTYDARFGAVTSLIGPNSLTTNWYYDNFGR